MDKGSVIRELVQRKPLHLGDGAYVRYDGYHIVLTAGVPTTDTIYLDSYVVENLLKYISDLKEKLNAK